MPIPMEFLSQNQNILLVSIIVISGLGLLWPLFKGAAANEVTPAAATQLINREEAQVIDVREVGEFANGHLPDAKNIPLSKLVDRVSELEKFKDKPLIVCCASGMRSAKGCSELSKLGFSRVFNLAGGMDAWIGAGYPVKKGGRNK